jgi:hypothetical protein
MKKIVLTSICTLALAGGAFAQGTVNFATFIPTYITGQTNSTAFSSFFGGGATGSGTVGVTATTANGFYYELLWTASGASAPTTLTQLSTWTDSTYYAKNGGTAGTLQAGNGNAGTAIATLAPATTGSFLLAGWSANLGTNWSSVSTLLNNWAANSGTVVGNAYFGISHVGQVTPAGTGSPGVNLFGTVASGLINSPATQLYLLPVAAVPEPGTLALAALGGASLLLFRRRK